jgi:hypothetical protein
MVAARDIELTEETVRELRAEGRQDRADALQAVLAVATSAMPKFAATNGRARPALSALDAPRKPASLEERRRDHEAVMAALPQDKVARLERLHERMEDGHRLSRAERSEMASLERELIGTASDTLERSLQRPKTP